MNTCYMLEPDMSKGLPASYSKVPRKEICSADRGKVGGENNMDHATCIHQGQAVEHVYNTCKPYKGKR